MKDVKNLVSRLEEISEVIDLDNFYSIGLSPVSGQISLQGNFSDRNAVFAKSFGVKLEYQEDSCMLKGETSDGKLRIVLT